MIVLNKRMIRENDIIEFAKEYAVAVVLKSSGIQRISDLRNKRPCYGEVGHITDWAMPMYFLYNNWTGSTGGVGQVPLRPMPVYPTTKSPGFDRAPMRVSSKDESGTNYNSKESAIVEQNGKDFQRSRKKRQSTANSETCATDFDIAFDVFSSSCAPGNWSRDPVFGPAYQKRLCAQCPGQCAGIR